MSRVVVAILLSLLGVASAREDSEGAGTSQAAPASSAARFDDTGRLYFSSDGRGIRRRRGAPTSPGCSPYSR